MNRKLGSTVLALVLAGVLAPIRLGLRGPAIVHAWGAISGVTTAVRGEESQRLMLADDDFFGRRHDVGDYYGDRDHDGDDRDDDGDHDHDRDDHHHRRHRHHHHHHRHHHSGDHDDDGDDGGYYR